MKKNKFLFLFILLASFKMNAQTFRIDTTELTFENKLRPCLIVKFDASAKTVKKGWADYFKKNFKIKIKGIGLLTDKDIVEAQDVTINSIADKRMNLFARVTDLPGGSEMKYFMSFGYDFFIGPDNYGNEFGNMHKLLNDFCIRFLNDFYSDEASRILKEIKGYENDIKKKNNAIASNGKKSKKGSDATASGLEAKNYAIQMDIRLIESKIDNLKKEIDVVKYKQENLVPKSNPVSD